MKVLFLGERRIAMRCLQYLSEIHQQRRLEIVGIVTTADLYHNANLGLSEASEIPFVDNQTRNENAITSLISTSRCNVLISVQHPWILSDDILRAVEYRAFNLHNAKLPDYKGYNSISHALLNGAKSYTTSIHWLSEKVDSGDVAYTKSIPVQTDDDAISLYERTLDPAVQIFVKLIEDLISNKEPPRIPQTGKSYFYSRKDLATTKDCSSQSVEDMILTANCSFFPPDEPAYIHNHSGKIYLIPESRWMEIVHYWRPANMPEI